MDQVSNIFMVVHRREGRGCGYMYCFQLYTIAYHVILSGKRTFLLAALIMVKISLVLENI